MRRVKLDGKPVSEELERALMAEMGDKTSALLTFGDESSDLDRVIEQCKTWRALGTRSLYIGGVVYAAEILLKMLGELSFPENRDQPDSGRSEDSLT